MDSKWKKRFNELAQQVGNWSREEVKVGAVAVDCNRHVTGVGFNGAPPGYDDSLVNESNSTFVVVHAEINALLNSTGRELTLVITHPPCLQCAGAIAASQRVVKVICPPPLQTGRWAESTAEGKKLLTSKDIPVEHP